MVTLRNVSRRAPCKALRWDKVITICRVCTVQYLNNRVFLSVRAITRNGYTVTSWDMAIWPPKLGARYKVPSELFSGLKSSLFPQGFAHNTAEQWSFGRVRQKWRLARRLRVSRRKPHCFVLFLLWFVHDKTPKRWKNQVRCNFFRIWKKICR